MSEIPGNDNQFGRQRLGLERVAGFGIGASRDGDPDAVHEATSQKAWQSAFIWGSSTSIFEVEPRRGRVDRCGLGFVGGAVEREHADVRC